MHYCSLAVVQLLQRPCLCLMLLVLRCCLEQQESQRATREAKQMASQQEMQRSEHQHLELQHMRRSQYVCPCALVACACCLS